jgi:hypothetical protein
MSQEEIPGRLPGESAGAYLDRLKAFQTEIQQIDRIKADIEKELSRRARRIDSIAERIIIEKEIRRSLRDPPANIPRPYSNRFYQIPHAPGALLLYPLILLCFLIWQNVTKTDTRFKKGMALSGREGRYDQP